MNKYTQTALKTVKNHKPNSDIIETYERTAKEVFPSSKSSQKKSCPKNTFLSLCEMGLVKHISKGNYTKSIKNKEYALKAVSILKANPNISYTPKELWEKLELGEKKHNSQMDVVLALWKNGYIKD